MCGDDKIILDNRASRSILLSHFINFTSPSTLHLAPPTSHHAMRLMNAPTAYNGPVHIQMSCAYKGGITSLLYKCICMNVFMYVTFTHTHQCYTVPIDVQYYGHYIHTIAIQCSNNSSVFSQYVWCISCVVHVKNI